MSHDPGSSTKSAADSAGDNKGLQMLARGGYAVSGLLHIIIGYLAVRVATGSGENADSSGAFQEIAKTPGGAVVLWFAVVAFAALAIWQITEAVAPGPGDEKERQAHRLKSAGKAVLYLVLAYVAFTFASGGGSGGGGGTQESLTAQVMGNPAGRILIGAIGVGIVAAAVFHVVKGWRKKFLEDLQGNAGGNVGKAVVVLGRVGYIAKGFALGVLGVLFVAAAATADPDKAGGLDDALKAIRDQPFGPVLLIATGIGFAAYGVYSFARARYAKL
ncbi:hypothetical protein GCM10025865_25510 [Paraoerskovia sediminicola]|uniref:DUF1206 domain-containing protein n=1 Tax=Paraoerskovia sediminicola TaxID=1138587 RepID=A0ABN6XE95_9CELL|nr:DUF1206 domain-containing protein [Paraoerskovia sediminicola]BDZ43252.1 hypothetical protein GCM10025865_25510 [Paraoerskovia sediminicola]